MAPPGSESTALFEGTFVNVGSPHSSPRIGVLPDKPKQRGRQNDYEGVSEPILPMKRVTTVEGRGSGNFNLGRETYMGETKPNNITETKLKRVTQLSDESPRRVFMGLMPHVNRESLISCFHELDGRKAVGIDQVTKEEYERDLVKNIDDLLSRMRSMTYYPSPVREVLIPKDDGNFRPLGISNLEDKIVQRMFSKILEAIYEPIFEDWSFGFRRGIGCHNAIKQCNQHLFSGRVNYIIDVDLENYFGSIDHKKLVAILRMKIKDERFIRYIVRMLKAGILSNGELRMSDEGSPQGSCCSPILSNIFAHYALDVWFRDIVKKHAKGQVEMYRYCDDIVFCCELQEDADKIYRGLKGRTERFSLKMNVDKTKRINFSKAKAQGGERQGTFDFLGFTFYLGKSRRGNYIPKIKSNRRKIKKKLQVVKEWCRINRHRNTLCELWKIFCIKLRGHAQYYAVSGNYRGVATFFCQATRIFFKWMNRRSQRRSFDWSKFGRFLANFPPPRVTIIHRLY